MSFGTRIDKLEAWKHLDQGNDSIAEEAKAIVRAFNDMISGLPESHRLGLLDFRDRMRRQDSSCGHRYERPFRRLFLEAIGVVRGEEPFPIDSGLGIVEAALNGGWD
jgi:hypothetical protein